MNSKRNLLESLYIKENDISDEEKKNYIRKHRTNKEYDDILKNEKRQRIGKAIKDGVIKHRKKIVVGTGVAAAGAGIAYGIKK
jgi:hypothetical protein